MIRWPAPFSVEKRFYTAAALGVAGMVALSALVFLALCGKWQEQRLVLAAMRARAMDGQAALKQLPSQEAAWSELQSRRQFLEQRLGKDQSLARVLEALSRQAKAHHLELVITQQRQESDAAPHIPLGGGFSMHRVVLSAQLTGRYRYLGEFFSEIPNAPYVMIIEAMHLAKPDAGNPKVMADLTLAVYLSKGAS